MKATLSEARALHTAGRLDEAERRYRDVLQASPAHPGALHLLGVIAYQRHDHESAVALCREAIAADPQYTEAYRALTEALLAQGKSVEAEAEIRRAIAIAPEQASLHFSLGTALWRQRRLQEAIAAYAEAVRLKSDLREAHLNLGVITQETDKVDDAIDIFQNVLGRWPDYASAHLNLGVALQRQRRYPEAIAAYEAALRLKPDYLQGQFSLGVAHLECGDLESAEAAFRRALTIAPLDAPSAMHLAHVVQVLGKRDEALALYREQAERGVDPANASRYLALALLYESEAGPAAHYAEQRRAEERFARPHYPASTLHGNLPEPERRLKIAYLSSDFRSHPVARNLELLLTNRDREKFEVYAYADVDKPDSATAILRQMVDHWCVVDGWSDERIAARMRADGIDILLILAAHFDRNRPLVAAYRPAPVQVSFHDPATSGLSVIDYLIADAVLAPRRSLEQFTERVVRLPNFYLHAPLKDAPPLVEPPVLAAGTITFGCFNSPAKLSDLTLSMWANILARVPGSRLVLKYRSYYRSAALRERIEKVFLRAGVAADRLDLGGDHETMGDHLANYGRVDIALDPTPFTGSTTTFESLWMGVPVVSLCGDFMAARWSASILHRVGLDDLVAQTPDAYVACAVRLAANTDRLRQLRGSLRADVAASILCDGPAMARHYQRLLRAMWRKWCKSLKPSGEESPETIFERGCAYHANGRSAEAADCFRRYIALRPRDAQAHFNLGLAQQAQGLLGDAVRSYERALDCHPTLRPARENLAFLFSMLGRTEQAVATYRAGLEILPRDIDLHRYLVAALSYDSGSAEEIRFAEARRFDAMFVKPLGVRQAHPNSRNPERVLKVAYLGSDFREHPVVRNLEPLLVHRDRSRFEVTVYADVAQPDAVTAQFRGMVDRWQPINGQSDEAVAGQIRADNIDILVVLGGHLDRNRLGVSAWRAAPLQISFHDVATSGTDAVDYLIADRIVCPRPPFEGFTERVIRMPGIYTHHPLNAPAVGALPAVSNGYITFGSFNNPAKLSNVTLGLWAGLLQTVPRSRLRLKFRRWFEVADIQHRIRSVMAVLGVDPARIDFIGADEDRAGHLAQYNSVDIALDAFPFAGSTTTFEALWMGVPVVTLAGKNMMSRWAASILHTLKLNDLIALSPDRYIATAAALAGDPGRLQDLRATLRARVSASPLCDGALRARQIERIYRAVWRRWCKDAA
jgi:predicted O-linked N-acetylglucosamine transferase (SPINDLY family)